MSKTSRWEVDDYSSFRRSATTDPNTGRAKAREEIFERDTVNPDFDPQNITVRESRDSELFPNSTPIIIALDATGSMGDIPDELIKDGLGRMVEGIYERKPVTDPHIMFMAIGDADHSEGGWRGAGHDEYPLQATQFEVDIRIAEQLKELYLEGNGGGNAIESYHLAWYFAARKTEIDSFTKRRQKGLLFTIGDEGVHDVLRAQDIKRVIGDDIESDIRTEDLLRMVQERYDVYHLVITQGSNYNRNHHAKWQALLGENVRVVSDYRNVPEVITSILEIESGRPQHDVVNSWDGSTKLVVAEATRGMTPGNRALQRTNAGGPPTVWRPGGPSSPGM